VRLAEGYSSISFAIQLNHRAESSRGHKLRANSRAALRARLKFLVNNRGRVAIYRRFTIARTRDKLYTSRTSPPSTVHERVPEISAGDAGVLRAMQHARLAFIPHLALREGRGNLRLIVRHGSANLLPPAASDKSLRRASESSRDELRQRNTRIRHDPTTHFFYDFACIVHVA